MSRAPRDGPRLLVWSMLLAGLALGCQVLFGSVEVTQNGSTDSSCTTGDFRCNDQYLLVCGSQSTGWTLKDTCASGDLCDAKDARCSACKPGDARCAGALRQQCAADGSSWQTVETCAAANLCSESSCTGCLTDGALDCSVAPDLRQCQGGVWVTLDTCVSQALCNATTAYAMTATDWDQKCVLAGCPVAGEYRCDGTTLERCPPAQDAWMTVDTCASAALCENVVAAVSAAKDPNAASTLDQCVAGCPTPGAFVCAGTALQQCRADQTGYDAIAVCGPSTECDPVAGVCGQLCTPGQYQCNGATLRKCGSSGHWVDQSSCETAPLCVVSADASTGSCAASPCGANEYTCHGATLQKCKADRTGYEDSQACASAALCDGPSARCIAPTCPTAGAYQCFGQDLKQCSTDLTTWSAVTTCPAGQLCNSGANPDCLTACPVSPVRCNGKVLEHCAAATGWTTQATCSTADLCSCTLTDPDGAGPLTNACLGGLYKDGCGNVVCGGSKANLQCVGAELQKCQVGRNGWDDSAACGQTGQSAAQAAALCYAGTAPIYSDGYCLTCPVAGELACNGNTTLRVCSDDRRAWNTSQSCANGCIAVQNGQDYCAACKAGAVQCDGAQPQSCNAARNGWNNAASACATAALCNGTKGTCTAPTCAVNEQRCSGTQPQICNSDRTKYVANGAVCATAALCDEMTFTCDAPACAVGKKQCAGSNLQICNADRTAFTNGTDCGAPGCNKTTSTCNTAICTPSAYRCEALTLEQCNASGTAWATVQTCPTICDAAGAECDDCVAPQLNCSGNTLQICSATGHWLSTDCLTNVCDAQLGTCDAAPDQ